jgi:hypothetical protein
MADGVTIGRDSTTGEPIDPIAAVVEVKGCWNDDLFTALGTQLVTDYMVQLGAPVGVYLVGWFDLVNWDPTTAAGVVSPSGRSTRSYNSSMDRRLRPPRDFSSARS